MNRVSAWMSTVLPTIWKLTCGSAGAGAAFFVLSPRACVVSCGVSTAFALSWLTAVIQVNGGRARLTSSRMCGQTYRLSSICLMMPSCATRESRRAMIALRSPITDENRAESASSCWRRSSSCASSRSWYQKPPPTPSTATSTAAAAAMAIPRRAGNDVGSSNSAAPDDSVRRKGARKAFAGFFLPAFSLGLSRLISIMCLLLRPRGAAQDQLGARAATRLHRR